MTDEIGIEVMVDEVMVDEAMVDEATVNVGGNSTILIGQESSALVVEDVNVTQ